MVVVVVEKIVGEILACKEGIVGSENCKMIADEVEEGN